MEDKPIVVITGISGFLGSWVGKTFLERGGYKVRGTVRDPNNERKVAPLKDAFGEQFDEVELVKADLLDHDSLDKAIEGATYVMHVASPFPAENPKDKFELIGPAVNGTLSVLEAAHKHGIKKVVITASCATIHCPVNKKEVYDETCFA